MNINNNNNILLLKTSLLQDLLLKSMKIDIQRFYYENYILKNRLNKTLTINKEDEEEIGFNNHNKHHEKRIRLSKQNENLYKSSNSEIIQQLIDIVYKYGSHYLYESSIKRIVTIQSWYRKWRQYICINNIDDDLIPENDEILIRVKGIPVICPITLMGITTKDCVKLVNMNGSVEAYSVTSLANYLKTTRKFESPTNRNPIIRYIVSKRIQPKIYNPVDLSNLYDTRHSFQQRNNDTENQILGLERVCADVLSQAILLCEGDILNGQDNNILHDLENDILPAWRDYIQTFINLNTISCMTMLLVDETRLQRLIDRNHDNTGYMPYLLTQIREYINTCIRRNPNLSRNTNTMRSETIRNISTPSPIVSMVSYGGYGMVHQHIPVHPRRRRNALRGDVRERFSMNGILNVPSAVTGDISL